MRGYGAFAHQDAMDRGQEKQGGGTYQPREEGEAGLWLTNLLLSLPQVTAARQFVVDAHSPLIQHRLSHMPTTFGVACGSLAGAGKGMPRTSDDVGLLVGGEQRQGWRGDGRWTMGAAAAGDTCQEENDKMWATRRIT